MDSSLAAGAWKDQKSTTLYEDNAEAWRWPMKHLAEVFRRSKHGDLRHQYKHAKIKKGKNPTSKVHT